MPKKKTEPLANAVPKKRALTAEAREKQLIGLATDLAEQQLRDGTASSQVITHYLKLGTIREEIEREKLRKETKLIEAKVSAVESSSEIKELYENAIKAMQLYQTGESNE